MNIDVGKRGMAEQNHMFFDRKRLNYGVVNGGLGSGSSTEDDTRFNKATEDGNNGLRGLIQIDESLQISQQPPQGSVIGWESFLPVRSIKVLLVEDDDSTRHVVHALLRNCSYEVTAVSNGLKAWEILKDPGNHIDLVLTEVAMPILSGIGLLCKTMSHKTLKNIPVISKCHSKILTGTKCKCMFSMSIAHLVFCFFAPVEMHAVMSSHDSMGIVFKCLSKGAADFLVKPIRKNELKNLWQHVWRRCHSSSGSGSESGTHTRKSAKSRSNDVSENNSDSCDENDCGSRILSVQGGSDKGSGTQSTWTKCLAQVGSPHPVSPHKQLIDALDSSSTQVMNTKPEEVSSKWVHATEKECHELINHLDDVAMGKDLAMGISLNMQLEHPLEFSSNPIKWINKMSDVDCKQVNEGHSNICEKGQLEYNSDKTRTLKNKAMNVVDVTDSSSSPQAESRELNTPNGFSGISKNKASGYFKQHPSLELTLKRLGEVRDAKNVTGDEYNVLRHSDLSAFSKYNTASSANQAQTGNVGSCSPLDSSPIAPTTETIYNYPSHSNGTPPNQQSNGSNNINDDMGSANTYLSTKPETFDKNPESVRGIGSFNSCALQTVQHNSISSSQKKNSALEEYAEIVEGQVGCSEQVFQVEHNYYNLHHYNHIAHKATPDKRSDHDDLLLKSSTIAAQQCVSSNVFGGPAESNAANFGMDGNAFESDHGSNGQDGSSNTSTIRATNVENGNAAAGSIGVGGIDRKNIGNGVDEGRIALREAALTKFRQKRKERCFEKRVRYHSRKKLAEQRPRIRGQFVRGIVSDTKEEKDRLGNNVVSVDNSSDVPQ